MSEACNWSGEYIRVGDVDVVNMYPVEVGRFFEEVAKDILEEMKGFTDVRITHQYTDIEATKDGKKYWIEVKSKKDATPSFIYERPQVEKMTALQDRGEQVCVMHIEYYGEEEYEGGEKGLRFAYWLFPFDRDQIT